MAAQEPDVTAKLDPEIFAGSSGSVTIGNGQNSEEEVEEEISGPVMILGNYLTSCQVFAEKVSCSIDPDATMDETDFENIVLVDENDQEIPNLRFELVNKNGVDVLEIHYPATHTVASVKETNAEGSAETEVPTEPVGDIILENRRCTLEILEIGISAKLNCPQPVDWMMYGAIKVGGDINGPDYSVVKS